MKIKILIISLFLLLTNGFSYCSEKLNDLYFYQGNKVSVKVLLLAMDNKITEDMKKNINLFGSGYVNINNMADYAGYPSIKEYNIKMMNIPHYRKGAESAFSSGSMQFLENLETIMDIDRKSPRNALELVNKKMDELTFELFKQMELCEVR